MPLTGHLVPMVFGVTRPKMRGSSSRGVRCVMSPPKLIDCITLALGRVGSSLLAVVEVAGHDLYVLPYHVGKSCSGLAPEGWHVAVAMS